MRVPPLPVTVSNVLLASLSKKSIHIPIKPAVPLHSLKDVDVHALIDSGAQISCIDWDFVKKH